MTTAAAPAATIPTSWCPTCQDETSLVDSGRCPWCSSTLYPSRGSAAAAERERAARHTRAATPPPASQRSAVVVSAPERSLAQRQDALRRANVIRSARAQLKRDLKAGRKSIIDQLAQPADWLETAKVWDMLVAVPKFGRVKTNKALVTCRISPSKTIGGLSDRQRTELLALLKAR